MVIQVRTIQLDRQEFDKLVKDGAVYVICRRSDQVPKVLAELKVIDLPPLPARDPKGRFVSKKP